MGKDKTRVPGDKNEDSTPVFEGWCTREVFPCAVLVESGDGDQCSSKNTRLIEGMETVKVPENSHAGTEASSPQKMVGSIAWLKCTFTNERGMYNEQEELEAIVQQKNSSEGTGKGGEAVG
ncbi:hephaestin-like protein 1 [Pitangus sulphuratus]|nr:hephaestin-like protein 1 [Pitangus sulphuratus]